MCSLLFVEAALRLETDAVQALTVFRQIAAVTGYPPDGGTPMQTSVGSPTIPDVGAADATIMADAAAVCRSTPSHDDLGHSRWEEASPSDMWTPVDTPPPPPGSTQALGVLAGAFRGCMLLLLLFFLLLFCFFPFLSPSHLLSPLSSSSAPPLTPLAFSLRATSIPFLSLDDAVPCLCCSLCCIILFD